MVDIYLKKRQDKCDKLKEENKNLKAENDRLKQNAMEDMRVQTKLEEEIDNCLKEVKLCYNDIHSLEWQISDLEEENRTLNENIKWYEKEEDRLRERIRFLEQCLDNKEKVNKQLREDIGKLVMNKA